MIYVCIPAHDEERTLGVLLWKIRQVMAEFGRDYQVLVLDDASGDRTADLLERYRRVVPVTVLREESRRGYRHAVQRLLREAARRSPYPKRDVAVLLQADFTERPEDIVSLVKVIEGGADIVAGVIGENGHPAPRKVRWLRRVAPIVLGEAYRKAPVSDPLCGFRAYRVIVLKKAFREDGEDLLDREGWAADLELLRVVAPHARRIEEAPLERRYDIRTRSSRLRPAPTLRELLKSRRLTWESTTPERGTRDEA